MSKLMSRRSALRLGAGGLGLLVSGAAGGYELIERGALPGKTLLANIDGACDVPEPQVSYGEPGPLLNGSFYSRARGTTVGYEIAYPPGHGPGSRGLPLIVALHGYDANHATAIANVAHLLALETRDGGPLRPMAIVTADGGNLSWHRHGNDDPMAMLVDELIPMCQRRGLDGPLAATGVSMGGYGALLLAERHPALVRVVSAISPAIWTTYAQARAANPDAFTSSADFAANDVITHAGHLREIPVRIAGGSSDPFHQGQLLLLQTRDASTASYFGPGCHDQTFFASQEPRSLEFIAAHLEAT
jgi:pimeloyl-ACP methyl ester carboxylesterase